MNNSFFDLSAEEQTGLIRKAADQFNVSDMIIEKDLWICWLLEKIFALPVQMAFKGGTSLSKVFGLIKRFSEDCDITIDYRNFEPDLILKNESKTQLRRMSDKLKEQLKAYISVTVLPYLQEQVLNSFGGISIDITLSDDGEQLRFYYPSTINPQYGYLRDHVFIEFGVRNSTEPCEKHCVSTYLQTVTESLNLPKPVVNTLSPVRTFWEKATLIHVECHRDRLVSSPERLSRHWYDLHMLNDSWVGTQALLSLEIFKNVIEHKKAFYNAAYANYDHCVLGKFRLIPAASLKHLEKDFLQMIEAGMFHNEPPKFNEIVESLIHLESRINSMLLKN